MAGAPGRTCSHKANTIGRCCRWAKSMAHGAWLLFSPSEEIVVP